jgi:aconitate hydratase
MGVLPLQFLPGENADTHKFTGKESYSIDLKSLTPQATLAVEVVDEKGAKKQFKANVRIDTPKELEYYQHGGILHYVLRQLTKSAA